MNLWRKPGGVSEILGWVLCFSLQPCTPPVTGSVSSMRCNDPTVLTVTVHKSGHAVLRDVTVGLLRGQRMGVGTAGNQL